MGRVYSSFIACREQRMHDSVLSNYSSWYDVASFQRINDVVKDGMSRPRQLDFFWMIS